MKVVNLLAVLVVVFLYILNDVVLANKVTSKTTTTTTTTHHRHNFHTHHRHRKHTSTTTHHPSKKHHHTSKTPHHRPHKPSPTGRKTTHHPVVGYPNKQAAPRTETTETATTTTNNDPSPLDVITSSTDSSAVASPAPALVDPNASTSPSVTSSPTTQDGQSSDSIQTQSILPGISSGNFALAAGLTIGGVAALGLVGYVVHRRREDSRSTDNEEGDNQVRTRWRHQSFMSKLEALVSRLPSDRSSGSSSKSKKTNRSAEDTPAPSPAMDHHTAPSTSTNQANFGEAYTHDRMEDVHLR